MTSLIEAIMEAESGAGKNSQFPHAPDGWMREGAIKAADCRHREITMITPKRSLSR
ncbi:MAG TPA: hypothetical protein VJ437_06585 [Acidiferrobacterales bacterium]|nr:hypothetical protein [Acidiferrobacterales bacterium]